LTTLNLLIGRILHVSKRRTLISAIFKKVWLRGLSFVEFVQVLDQLTENADPIFVDLMRRSETTVAKRQFDFATTSSSEYPSWPMHLRWAVT
jgi:hypothetical protein